MEVEVIIDIGPDGRYVARVVNRPDAYSRADTKEEAERCALALYMEELARKIRRGHLLISNVFPLKIKRVDQDFSICICTLKSNNEDHYRIDHNKIILSEDSGVLFADCQHAGCHCKLFDPLIQNK